jgi:predicted nucleic acid-binding protein
MIVIVETNFIIELVLQQKEIEACEELMSLCSAPSARMVVPAFAIAEAGRKLEQKRGERRLFIQKDLTNQAREIGRSRNLGRFEKVLRALNDELLTAESDEASRWLILRTDLGRLELIPMDAEILEETIAIQLGREIASLPDAIVFASVKTYLHGIRNAGVTEPACFVSRDTDAFGTDVIRKRLRKLDCKVFTRSFGDAAASLRASIKRP